MGALFCHGKRGVRDIDFWATRFGDEDHDDFCLDGWASRVVELYFMKAGFGGSIQGIEITLAPR